MRNAGWLVISASRYRTEATRQLNAAASAAANNWERLLVATIAEGTPADVRKNPDVQRVYLGETE